MSSPIRPNFALLLGNGSYARGLHGQLQDEARAIYSLFPRHLSQFGDDEVAGHVSLIDRQGLYRSLRARGVTHIVFAGGFRLSTLIKGVWYSPSIMVLLGGFVRYGSVAGMLNALEAELEEAGLTLMHVGDVAPDYRLGEGHIAGPPPRDKNLFAFQIEKAFQALKDQPRRGVRQSVVLEGRRVAAREKTQTDKMLKKLARRATPKAPRTLIKLSTEHFNTSFDAPVIGPRTIELAQKAGIKTILFEAYRGVVVDKEEVIRRCDEAGISLVGIHT